MFNKIIVALPVIAAVVALTFSGVLQGLACTVLVGKLISLTCRF